MKRATRLAIASFALSLTSTAFAADVIYACVKNSNPNKGTLRIIEAGGTCSPNELPLQWVASVTAPSLACPTGTRIFTGVCVESAAREAIDHSSATSICAAAGRRLPSGGELSGFRQLPQVQLASPGEWTDDLGDIATSSTFKYFAVSQFGNGVAEASTLLPYRCVAGAQIQ